jgi:transketolase
VRETFVKSLLELGKKDPNLVLLTGDLGFGVLDAFQKELPEQYINSGINEQTMMGLAAGYASTGKRVFVYSIGNFPTLRCLEQIRNDICLMNNSVVIVSVGAGYSYGSQGYTHHAIEDIAVMRALPNIEVVVPSSSYETAEITKYLAGTKHPAYFRLGKNSESTPLDYKLEFEPRKINVIIQGGDGTLIFSGSLGKIAQDAAILLAKNQLNVEVASMPFINSFDESYLRSAAKKGPIVVIEEHSYFGGVGSAILEYLNLNSINANIALVAADRRNPSQIGDQSFLRSMNGITAEHICEKFNVLLGE